MVTIEWFDLVL